MWFPNGSDINWAVQAHRRWLEAPSFGQGWNTRTCSCTRTYSSTVFPVLSNTQYSAKFLSTSTRTYSSTDAKSPVLMSILRVQLSTFLKIYVFLYFERFFFRALLVQCLLVRLIKFEFLHSCIYFCLLLPVNIWFWLSICITQMTFTCIEWRCQNVYPRNSIYSHIRRNCWWCDGTMQILPSDNIGKYRYDMSLLIQCFS